MTNIITLLRKATGRQMLDIMMKKVKEEGRYSRRYKTRTKDTFFCVEKDKIGDGYIVSFSKRIQGFLEDSTNIKSFGYHPIREEVANYNSEGLLIKRTISETPHIGGPLRLTVIGTDATSETILYNPAGSFFGKKGKEK